MLVSLADKVDNAEAILNDYRNIGDDLWGRFTGGREVSVVRCFETCQAFREGRLWLIRVRV